MIRTEPEAIKQGIFLKRENRFVATVLIDHIPTLVHVPNSGRMKELLIPNAPVGLMVKKGEHRKTKFQLTWIFTGQVWVNVDSLIPNKLVAAGVMAGEMAEFKGFQLEKTEVTVGNSRLDLLLAHRQTGKKLYLEVKSVTLVEEKTGKFPDAPTVRGTKHLQQLEELIKDGVDGAVIFIVQRQDAVCFRPNHETDAEFGQALRHALAAGVRAYAYNCLVHPGMIKLNKPIPVIT
ncbi:MAG: DNA/RNA nuclease SfsA [Clostridia bacterium]|nr:DNA/RNA nuclease SfsA [Clostridia bacterium]